MSTFGETLCAILVAKNIINVFLEVFQCVFRRFFLLVKKKAQKVEFFNFLNFINFQVVLLQTSSFQGQFEVAESIENT